MITLIRLFQYFVILIMGIIALVAYQKKRATIAALPYWIAIVTTLISWAINIEWDRNVLWLASISIDSFGFFLMALAPLTGKKGFAYAAAIWFLLIFGFFFLAIPSYITLVDFVVLAIFASSVFWIGKISNTTPKYIFIALAALAVILGAIFAHLWRNIALVGICYYLLEPTISTARPKTINVSPTANMDDTLKSLELLQELRDSGVITQDEFDAKKKQLLDL